MLTLSSRLLSKTKGFHENLVLSYYIYNPLKSYTRNIQILIRSQHNLVLIYSFFGFQDLCSIHPVFYVSMLETAISVSFLNDLIHYLHQSPSTVRSNMKSCGLSTQKPTKDKLASSSTRSFSQAMKTQKINSSSYLLLNLSMLQN